MATTLDDVLSRRTRARLLARDATSAAAEDVARLLRARARMGRRHGSAPRSTDFRAALEHERTAAGLPHTVPDSALDA